MAAFPFFAGVAPLLAAGVLVAELPGFLATGFLAAVFLAAGLLAALFFAAGFRAGAFLTALFFAAGLRTAVFLAALFLAAGFLAAGFRFAPAEADPEDFFTVVELFPRLFEAGFLAGALVFVDFRTALFLAPPVAFPTVEPFFLTAALAAGRLFTLAAVFFAVLFPALVPDEAALLLEPELFFPAAEVRRLPLSLLPFALLFLGIFASLLMAVHSISVFRFMW